MIQKIWGSPVGRGQFLTLRDIGGGRIRPTGKLKKTLKNLFLVQHSIASGACILYFKKKCNLEGGVC